MNRWFTSDWHLGDDRFEIMQRPFKTKEEHIDVIIKNHNSVVGKNDLVYVIGDVVYKKCEDPEKYIKMIDKMHGKKILIKGNHDIFNPKLYEPHFDEIFDDGDGTEISFGKEKFYLNHYPYGGSEDMFNLVGHIHGLWKVQLNMLNVGLDVNHYHPMSEETVKFYHDAIMNYYDKDCFAGYLKPNEVFRNKRGKKKSSLEA